MTRGTSDRLRADMDEEAGRLTRIAHAYRMTGDNTLANTAHAASVALRQALEAINRHIGREAEASRSQQEKRP